MISTSFTEILSILFVCLIIYVSHYYYKYFTRENPLPGPIPLPLIGNLFQICSDTAVWPSKLQEKYGDFYEVYVGSRRLIWLCSEDLIQKIMKPTINGNFHNLVSADNDGLEEIGLLDSGVVYNLNYKNWEYHRRFYARTIAKPLFLIQTLSIIQEEFKEMENYWENLGEDTVLDLSHWMKRYFTDTLFLIAANKQARSLASYYGSLSGKRNECTSESILKESDTFLEAVDGFAMCLIYFLLFPKIVRNFPGIKSYTQRLKNQLNWFRNSTLNIIKERREEIERTPEDQQLTYDILTMFITINTPRDITEKIADNLHDKPMSDEEICGNFIETITGGIDTSSNSICFIIHYLSHYPNVKGRLMEEFDRVLGKDPNYKITYDDIGKLEYCEAVISECSRIFSVLPILFKNNANPDEIGGLTFPANTQFYINFQGIHKHKSLWENPEEFNPERFMDKTNPESKNPLYTFGGPGRNLGMMELKVTLALLYRKYDVELADMKAPIKFHTTVVRTCDELKVRIKKRKI
ncbi:467_t:CDS:2 [Acaulospora colombiana]|uniref:467_t:CDS:1 n=1 Tax=Acaulospora colombiana TaxID=27376 RepID=A0ACA9M2B2_9GLOM|nr:467_t:CDS:2 [Acaulospora colombiana]